MSVTGYLLLIVISSFVIMYACESFEEASQFLGRNMPPGIRGATVNAIGSSLPELMTTFFFLVLFHDVDGFSAGIATAAGSAVFNAILIPAFCILAVVKSPLNPDADLTFIEVEPITVLRDGFFFILAEVALVYFLSDPTMTWWMGGTLMLLYCFYIAFLLAQGQTVQAESGIEPSDFHLSEFKSLREAVLTFDFRQILFRNPEYTTGSAWAVLGVAIVFISAACFLLTESVIHISRLIEVPSYFTAVILAAAATSVPDTILSVHDARDGYYDDAISNALGSNIFDITVALGLPLFGFGLFSGDVQLATEAGTVAAVRELPALLIGLTILVLAMFLVGKKVGRKSAYGLIALYGFWMVYIVGGAAGIEWARMIGELV